MYADHSTHRLSLMRLAPPAQVEEPHVPEGRGRLRKMGSRPERVSCPAIPGVRRGIQTGLQIQVRGHPEGNAGSPGPSGAGTVPQDQAADLEACQIGQVEWWASRPSPRVHCRRHPGASIPVAEGFIGLPPWSVGRFTIESQLYDR